MDIKSSRWRLPFIFILLLPNSSLFGPGRATWKHSLFGEGLGVSSTELLPLLALTGVTLVGVALVFRSLVLTTLMPDMAHVRGVNIPKMEIVFLLLVALVTTTAVPIVGTLLVFSLMIGYEKCR